MAPSAPDRQTPLGLLPTRAAQAARLSETSSNCDEEDTTASHVIDHVLAGLGASRVTPAGTHVVQADRRQYRLQRRAEIHIGTNVSYKFNFFASVRGCSVLSLT